MSLPSIFSIVLHRLFVYCLVLSACMVPAAFGEEKTVSSMTEAKPVLHYRPKEGRLADTIPFFWKGEYHIFYLRGNIGKVPWEHIVSTDLVHWHELPTALVSDGAENGPDGEHMFTGSVTEKDGTFHIFYTGWNPRNTEGREWVMQATSPDLTTWTKHPEHGFRADGEHYQNTDFRDPYVFWNEEDKHHWMIVCARDGKSGKPVQGVLRSQDLLTWTQEEPLTLDPPLGEGTPECPDVFKIGNLFYLVHSPSAGTTDMRWAENLRGPYRPPAAASIDTPILYAAKRMFDGKRHIISGWLRDLGGYKDGGGFEWGGDQSVPREVYAGADGQLLFKPVPEALALFTKDFSSLTGTVIGKAESTSPAHAKFGVPTTYLLDCTVEFDPAATFKVRFHRQKTNDSGYCLVVNPASKEVTIRGATFNYPRPVPLDPGQPVHIQAIVEGSIIECFVNDGYAFSCRAYDHKEGALGLEVSRGMARISELNIKTMDNN